MAILRTQLQGTGAVSHSRTGAGQPQSACQGTYEGLAESAADLTAARTAAFAPGSLMYCLADRRVYVKTGSGSWEAM